MQLLPRSSVLQRQKFECQAKLRVVQGADPQTAGCDTTLLKSLTTTGSSHMMHAEHAHLHVSQPPDTSAGACSHQAATYPVLLAGQLGLQADVLLLLASCCSTSCLTCRFELAVQLGELDVALDIAESADSEGKWRQLSELAMSTGKLEVSSSLAPAQL